MSDDAPKTPRNDILRCDEVVDDEGSICGAEAHWAVDGHLRCDGHKPPPRIVEATRIHRVDELERDRTDLPSGGYAESTSFAPPPKKG